MTTTAPEPLDQRFVVMMSKTDVERVEAYGHAQRLFGRSEALRQIVAAGMKALGLDDAEQSQAQASVAALDDDQAPTIPAPEDCGRPVLGELVLPWLREQGRRSYTLDEVVQGVFGDTAAQPGRPQVVTNVFKAIGWKGTTSRRAGMTTRTFTAPEA